MKRAAETSSERLRQVFNETCREDPDNISVTFRQMENSMCKRRRKLLPPLPMNPEDFCHLIPDSQFVHLCKGSVNNDGAYAIIFATDFMLMNPIRCNFYTVPSILSALYNLHILSRTLYSSHSRILMQTKTEDLNTIVLMKIPEIIPELSPKIAVCDF